MSPDPRSDEELVQALNSGDQTAFEALYFRYRDWVMRLAYHVSGNREDALDVLQETFAYLISKFPGFRLTARMTTFLYPVVKNLSIAARRKSKRFSTPEEGAEQVLASPSGQGGIGGSLASVLQGLPEEYRETLRMRFVDGMGLQEIAQALEIPLGTVKSRLHTALQTLREDPRTKDLLEP